MTSTLQSAGTDPQGTAALAKTDNRPASGRCLVVGLLLATVLPAGTGWASCEPKEGPSFTPVVVKRFLQNPAKVLGSGTSEYGLEVFTLQYAATRSRDLDVFRAVLISADRKQRDAIALGFARAVLFCRLADGTVAQRIEKWVSKIPMQDVLNTYQQTMALKDDTESYQPVVIAAPNVEDRFGAGLDLMQKPGPAGVGSLQIPDPTRLPGD